LIDLGKTICILNEKYFSWMLYDKNIKIANILPRIKYYVSYIYRLFDNFKFFYFRIFFVLRIESKV